MPFSCPFVRELHGGVDGGCPGAGRHHSRSPCEMLPKCPPLRLAARPAAISAGMRTFPAVRSAASCSAVRRPPPTRERLPPSPSTRTLAPVAPRARSTRGTEYSHGVRASAGEEKGPDKPEKIKGPSEWELGVGDSIRILRDDLDSFLETGFTDTTIYSPDIRFREERYSKLHLKGIQSYLMAASLFRGLVLAYFESPLFHVISFRQARESELADTERGDQRAPETEDAAGATDEERNRIHLLVRWRLEGTSRFASLIAGFNPNGVPRTVYEGVSLYALSHVDGKVASHTVLGIIPAPPDAVLSVGRA
ncbi:hypothetical protein DFJ74DRAFT_691495 [Hyaloraphidium curvatum]|nr:hypothetical protein DFJ74DRAFT_691495 [Hyaloraphidium curvatum]